MRRLGFEGVSTYWDVLEGDPLEFEIENYIIVKESKKNYELLKKYKKDILDFAKKILGL